MNQKRIKCKLNFILSVDVDEDNQKEFPKCCFEPNPFAIECPACGIVYKKLNKLKKRVENGNEMP